MPAEFEPHSGCWMLWPERPDNWRARARPAQQAFAAVAAAIARFEPVTVGASARAIRAARALLPPRGAAGRAVERRCLDARRRAHLRESAMPGELRGVHWRFNAWGGLYQPCERDRPGRTEGAGDRASARATARPSINEGGAIHVDGQGNGAGHRAVPAQPQPQSHAVAAADRGAAAPLSGRAARSSGSGKVSSTMRPRDTSTIWPASRVPARSA